MKRFGKREALRMVRTNAYPDTLAWSVTTDGSEPRRSGSMSRRNVVPARRACLSSYA